MSGSKNTEVKDMFYYVCSTSHVEKTFVLPLEDGATLDSVRPLYKDKKLTKKVGTIKFSEVKLGTSKEDVPIFDIVATITTNEGTIKYMYIRYDYEKITVDTIATSGIYTPGTITRLYLDNVENSLTRTRRLLYKSRK